MKMLTKLKLHMVFITILLAIILVSLISFVVYTKAMELQSYETMNQQTEILQDISDSLQKISNTQQEL